MFVDSLHHLHINSNEISQCLLASSVLEVCVNIQYSVAHTETGSFFLMFILFISTRNNNVIVESWTSLSMLGHIIVGGGWFT